MDTLDTLVTERLVADLLQPDRLRATRASLWALRAERATQVDGRVAALRSELATAEEKLRRLYRLVENGDDEPDDLLKERLSSLRAERDLAKAALGRIRMVSPKPTEIGPRTDRALRAIVDRIEVGADVIRIVGDKESLENALTGSGGEAVSGVRSSVRKWRTRHDSNV